MRGLNAGGAGAAGCVQMKTASPTGDVDGWSSRPDGRLDLHWQDGGVRGRDLVEQQSQSIAPSIAFGVDVPTRTADARAVRQSNLSDGMPDAIRRREKLAPATVLALGSIDSIGGSFAACGRATMTASRVRV